MHVTIQTELLTDRSSPNHNYAISSNIRSNIPGKAIWGRHSSVCIPSLWLGQLLDVWNRAASNGSASGSLSNPETAHWHIVTHVRIQHTGAGFPCLDQAQSSEVLLNCVSMYWTGSQSLRLSAAKP